jgi:hypothetical protein
VRTLSYVIASLLCSAPAFAQVSVRVTAPPPPRVVVQTPPPARVVVAPPPRVVVRQPPPARVVVAPPAVHFAEPPPLVMVEPGVEVVQDCDDEVFFSNGYYWYASDDGTWFRSRSHRGGWVMASPRVVPVRLAHIERGHYRHYRGEGRRWEHRDERRWEHHDNGHGHGHGNGHGHGHH